MDPELVMRIMKRIRAQPQNVLMPEWEPDTCNIYFEEARLDGRPYLAPLVILKTNPCHWLRTGGGCTMCNYTLVAALEHDVTSDNILNQVRFAIRSLTPIDQYPLWLLASGGSFMDSEEICDDTRVEIMKLLSKVGVKGVGFESRPEYLTDTSRLRRLRTAFKGEISAGIGLESSDDFIRQFCINKGYRLRTYEKAILALDQCDIKHYAYVLLGKPFLSASEDVEDAVKTIRFALARGANMIILMVTNLQLGTLTHWLWQSGLYELPKLWAPLKVLGRLSPDERQKVAIKGVDKAVPTPLEFAQNCERCTPQVIDAIIQWNYSGDYRMIESVQECCSCKREWLSKTDEQPLQMRVEAHYDRISKELLRG